MDNADTRLILRQCPQVDTGDCCLKVVSQAAHDNLGGTAAGQALRHVDDRLIDGRTGRYDPELLFAIGRGGEGGSGAKLKSFGDRRFADVHVNRSGVRRGVNHSETTVSRLPNPERLATGNGDGCNQRQELDIAVGDLSKREDIVDLSRVYLDARGGKKRFPRVCIANFQIVQSRIDGLVVGRVRELDPVDHRLFSAGNADGYSWGIWYGVNDAQPGPTGFGLGDVDRVRLELDVGELANDGKDIGCPAVKRNCLIDDRRTTIRWHDLDLMVAG
jgi:hypothetical protein